MKFSIIAALLSCVSSIAIAQTASDDPNTLMGIHERIGTEIFVAQKDLDGFDEGILKNMIQLRIEVLRLNQAIIESRLLGADVAPPAALPSIEPDPELAARIRSEMARLEAQIEISERDVANTGGALVALPMTRLETEKVSLALLQASLIRAEFGVISPIHNEMQFPGPQADGGSQPIPGLDEGAPPATPVVAAPSQPEATAAKEADVTAVKPDPRFPRVDYSRPMFRNPLPDGMKITGYWMHGPMGDGNGYSMFNFSNVTTEDGQGEPTLVALCGQGWSAMLVSTGKVLRTGGRNRAEVTMAPDWGVPEHKDMWEIDRNGIGDGDSLKYEGSRNIMFMGDSRDLRFVIRDDASDPMRITFQVDGISEVMSEMFAPGRCTLDDFQWSKEEITVIQEHLNMLGYDVGTADGSFGAKSREALRRWQMDNGLRTSGKFDYQTITGMGFYKRQREKGLIESIFGTF